MTDPYTVKVLLRVRAYWTLDGELLAFLPGPGSKVTCSICHRTGLQGDPSYALAPGSKHWQRRCLDGHPVACRTCQRRFTSPSGLTAHTHPRRPGGCSIGPGHGNTV